MRIQRIILEDKADAPVFRREIGDIVVTEKDLPRCGLFETADQVQTGRFSASRSPEKPDQLSVRDFKGEIVDSNHVLPLFVSAGELFGQILKDNFHSPLHSFPDLLRTVFSL